MYGWESKEARGTTMSNGSLFAYATSFVIFSHVPGTPPLALITLDG